MLANLQNLFTIRYFNDTKVDLLKKLRKSMIVVTIVKDKKYYIF